MRDGWWTSWGVFGGVVHGTGSAAGGGQFHQVLEGGVHGAGMVTGGGLLGGLSRRSSWRWV